MSNTTSYRDFHRNRSGVSVMTNVDRIMAEAMKLSDEEARDTR